MEPAPLKNKALRKVCEHKLEWLYLTERFDKPHIICKNCYRKWNSLEVVHRKHQEKKAQQVAELKEKIEQEKWNIKAGDVYGGDFEEWIDEAFLDITEEQKG